LIGTKLGRSGDRRFAPGRQGAIGEALEMNMAEGVRELAGEREQRHQRYSETLRPEPPHCSRCSFPTGDFLRFFSGLGNKKEAGAR
jgi:hypothetical protein